MPETAQTLLHIAAIDRWHVEDLYYTDPSLISEGFIHCSTVDQVLIPANERFCGRTDLLLLVIAPAAVDADIVFEDCYDSGLAFPHIYGPLPISAVIKVVPFPPDADGTFSLPEVLRAP